MTDILKLVRKQDAKYLVLFASNSVLLGEFIQDVDGYFYFWNEDQNGGAWQAYVLRAVADKLDELNKAWDDQIKSDPAISKMIREPI